MMMQIMMSLECVHFTKGEVIYQELDECLMTFFFITGSFSIGFEMNRHHHPVVKFTNTATKGQIIGAYGCTFDKRSSFLYKTLNDCEGFFIRKGNWKEALEESPELSKSLSINIKQNYEESIQKPIMARKREAMEKWKTRNDYEGILSLDDFDKTEDQIPFSDVTTD